MEELKCPYCGSSLIYVYGVRAEYVSRAKKGELIIEKNNHQPYEQVRCAVCDPNVALPTKLVEKVKELNRTNVCEARMTWLTQ